jgi:hypothetical protein
MRTWLAVAVLAACRSAAVQTASVPAPRTLAEAQGAGQVPTAPTRPAPRGDDPGPPAPPARQFEHDMMVRYHMHGSLDVLRAIERLLVRGNLDDARALARTIAEAPDEPDLGAWGPEAAAVRLRAQALAVAPGIDEACRREARLAAACADCHVETRIQPEFRAAPALPPDSGTVVARMARHRWAVDRLWEGLVGADDDAWHAGLAVLAAAPLPWTDLDARVLLARRLHQLADAARLHSATDTLDDRARSYGELLVTCAACHTIGAPR